MSRRSLPAPRKRFTHLDRALPPPFGLRVLAVDDRDGAEADAAGEDLRLAEGLTLRSAVRGPEVEVLGHAETTQRGRGHRAPVVRDAAVTVDVEDVDLLRLRRLRRDREQRAILLARQLQPELQRAIGARHAALDGERPAQACEQVLRRREGLDALANDRLVVADVGLELDVLQALQFERR